VHDYGGLVHTIVAELVAVRLVEILPEVLQNLDSPADDCIPAVVDNLVQAILLSLFLIGVDVCVINHTEDRRPLAYVPVWRTE
jgi:hypothetical protein